MTNRCFNASMVHQRFMWLFNNIILQEIFQNGARHVNLPSRILQRQWLSRRLSFFGTTNAFSCRDFSIAKRNTWEDLDPISTKFYLPYFCQICLIDVRRKSAKCLSLHWIYINDTNSKLIHPTCERKTFRTVWWFFSFFFFFFVTHIE